MENPKPKSFFIHLSLESVLETLERVFLQELLFVRSGFGFLLRSRLD